MNKKNLFPITHYEYVKKTEGYKDLLHLVNEGVGTSPVDFNIFADWFESSDFLSKLINKNPGDIQLFARQLYHSWMMTHCGDKIYYMSRDVCDLIQNTNLTIDAEFIEAPFQQIYIYTEQEDLLVKDARNTAPMKGLYLSIIRNDSGKKFLRFIATSSTELIKTHSDVNYFATFEIPKHGKLSDIADSEIEKYKVGKRFNDIDLSLLKDMFIFCVNSLLYIGCKNADLINITPENLLLELQRKKSGKKRSKIQRGLEKYNQCPYIIIQPKRLYNSDGEISTGKSLDHEVLVSGYWRGQWYGPKNGERKKEIIRIQPYLKGAGLKKIESKKIIVKL